MSRTAKQILKDIITDVDAMRCEAPYDVLQDGDDESKRNWFGGFSEGHVDTDTYEMYIQWPNLGILVENAAKVIGKHDSVRAAMIDAKRALNGDSNDDEHDALIELLEALEEAGV